MGPKIEALEKRIAELEQKLFMLNATVMEHEKQLYQKRGIFDQIDALKAKLSDSKPEYQPRFEHWPGNGG